MLHGAGIWIPTCAWEKSPSHVDQYASTMEQMGNGCQEHRTPKKKGRCTPNEIECFTWPFFLGVVYIYIYYIYTHTNKCTCIWVLYISMYIYIYIHTLYTCIVYIYIYVLYIYICIIYIYICIIYIFIYSAFIHIYVCAEDWQIWIHAKQSRPIPWVALVPAPVIYLAFLGNE